MTKISTFKKPTLASKAAQAFVTGGAEADSGHAKGYSGGKAEIASDRVSGAQKSGQIPEGDVRLTANIRADLHLKLKIRAAQERTTVGELIEQWIETWR